MKPVKVREAQTAPGKPGQEPQWSQAAKSGVGTAASECSHVWFTLSQGIINEVYYPYMDQANLRELQFVVTDGEQYVAEEQMDMTHQVEWLEEGIPAYRLTNTCKRGRCQIVKLIYTDPEHHSLIVRVLFRPLMGNLSDYRIYAIVDPQLQNSGYDNDGWIEDSKGFPMLFARRAGTCLAMGASAPFLRRSCGYVGVTDGKSDLRQNRRLTQAYRQSPSGNVSLTGEIDLADCEGAFQVVIGFGRGRAEASQQVRATLLADPAKVQERYLKQWRKVQGRHLTLGRDAGLHELYQISTSVLQTHMAKSRTGCLSSSLSVPWGYSRGESNAGGYHLVWPREQVLSGAGFLAAGDARTARLVLYFLLTNQEADGHWVQNMWGDGTPMRDGVQIDETALPILLADALYRQGELGTIECQQMVRKAASYLLKNGPYTDQGRWNEKGGLTPFSVATQIAALLAAADWADRAGDQAGAQYLRETADAWNSSIERWLYVVGTPLARELGIEGYYVGRQSIDGEAEVISTDPLALVRFGLRGADDPRMLNTVKVIDHVLKGETTTGPIWRRFTDDRYGEHDDGQPFDGMGRGHGWPVLAAERGHYELARGDFAEVEHLLQTLLRQTGAGGFLPEQVWDGIDLPQKGLYNGCPTGSAMPLVWAHAEFIKLLRSLQEQSLFDLPPQPFNRYQVTKQRSRLAIWRFDDPIAHLARTRRLRVQTDSPATIRWSTDQWETRHDMTTQSSGWGLWSIDLPTEALPRGSELRFTFHWSEIESWEGRDYTVKMR